MTSAPCGKCGTTVVVEEIADVCSDKFCPFKDQAPVDATPEKPEEPEARLTFKQELVILINKHSMENGSDTNDFILAAFLMDCLTAFNLSVKARDRQKKGM